MMNKKGISSVVATVLIILLTVVAVGLLGQFVVPYVQNTLDDSSICLDYQKYASFNSELNFNCYNVLDKEYYLSVQTASKPELTSNVRGFVFVFENKTESIPVRVVTNSSIGIYGETGFELPDSGETITYNYSSESQYTSVAIYTLINDKKGIEKLCEYENDKAELGRCS